jgi:glycosyltransferase involved in cell wall biosynthesis
MKRRPPAPWALVEIDLAAPLSALARPEGAEAALLVIRCDGAPLGMHPVLAAELPISAADLGRLASQAVAPVVADLLRLDGEDAPAPTPARPPRVPTIPRAVADGDALGALRASIARRRARPAARSVAIAICTRRRPADLAVCLDGIAAEIAAGREIVVVDNGPDAETEAVVRARPGVRYVPEPRPGLSAARNAALGAAAADVVAFVDDDVRPEPGWLGPLAAAFDRPEVAVVCGLVLPHELETDAQIAFQYDLGFGGMGGLPLRFDREFEKGWSWGPPVDSIGAGANMAVDRMRALAMGGFDERLGPGAAGGCADDSEYWRRVLHAGLVARYEPLSVVRHRHRRDWEALRAQARGYGLGHIAALFAQYAYTRDPRDLRRAFQHMPLWVLRRAALAPFKGLVGRPDRLAGSWVRGVFAGLRHAPMAFAPPWGRPNGGADPAAPAVGAPEPREIRAAGT